MAFREKFELLGRGRGRQVVQRATDIAMLKARPGVGSRPLASVSDATLRGYIGRGPASELKSNAATYAAQVKYDRIKKKNDAAGRRSGPRPV